MRILVFPDIHEAENVSTDVEAAIARESPDLTIFLGDWFDRWHDGPADAECTALWLKESLRNHNRVHLLGNHDLAYRFPAASEGYCSGFTADKAAAINAVMTPEDWAKTRFSWWHENLLFSHAGWSAHHAIPQADVATLRQYLDAQEYAAFVHLERDKPHWVYATGWKRGGLSPAGGLVWCHFPHEFTPIPGINQMFGHTPKNLGPVITGDRSVNVCLDTTDQVTGVNHYLLVDVSRRPITAIVRHIRGHNVKEINFS
jgi:hypothetical protein